MTSPNRVSILYPSGMRCELNLTQLLRLLAACCSLFLLSACGGTGSAPAAPPTPQRDSSCPQGLPVDGVQPWEVVDSVGRVVPAPRSASSLNEDSEFSAGIERFLEGGDVSDLNWA